MFARQRLGTLGRNLLVSDAAAAGDVEHAEHCREVRVRERRGHRHPLLLARLLVHSGLGCQAQHACAWIQVAGLGIRAGIEGGHAR